MCVCGCVRWPNRPVDCLIIINASPLNDDDNDNHVPTHFMTFTHSAAADRPSMAFNYRCTGWLGWLAPQIMGSWSIIDYVKLFSAAFNDRLIFNWKIILSNSGISFLFSPPLSLFLSFLHARTLARTHRYNNLNNAVINRGKLLHAAVHSLQSFDRTMDQVCVLCADDFLMTQNILSNQYGRPDVWHLCSAMYSMHIGGWRRVFGWQWNIFSPSRNDYNGQISHGRFSHVFERFGRSFLSWKKWIGEICPTAAENALRICWNRESEKKEIRATYRDSIKIRCSF